MWETRGQTERFPVSRVLAIREAFWGGTPAFLAIVSRRARKTGKRSVCHRVSVTRKKLENVPSVPGFTHRFYAARYLSRHSFEQKYNTCPSTVRVTLAPVET